MRWLWGALGALFLALAVIGAVLPVMPTVPFLIVASYCFARSSPRMQRWMLEHPTFGPQLVAWQTHRAIPRTAKIIALVSMAVGAVMGGFVLQPWMWAVQLAILAAVAAYISTRPAPPKA
ncbi:MAG: YbaN family protein [Paracoccus sp. (in: a-proteobacteria)]|nr:YbaN family protein [Paracoccus sp. (in: a-proteobacteria)]